MSNPPRWASNFHLVTERLVATPSCEFELLRPIVEWSLSLSVIAVVFSWSNNNRSPHAPGWRPVIQPDTESDSSANRRKHVAKSLKEVSHLEEVLG
jgi:hypothetical protein